MERNRDVIDRILEQALTRPGLIDWNQIDAELARIGAKVERRVLHRRLKWIIKDRFKKR